MTWRGFHFNQLVTKERRERRKKGWMGRRWKEERKGEREEAKKQREKGGRAGGETGKKGGKEFLVRDHRFPILRAVVVPPSTLSLCYPLPCRVSHLPTLSHVTQITTAVCCFIFLLLHFSYSISPLEMKNRAPTFPYHLERRAEPNL